MSQRFSVHVDSAYLIAQAGEALHGTRSRSRLEIAYPGLVDQIIETATAGAEGLGLLRLCWCDASANGAPEFEQRQVARLPRVKIRLGRLVDNQRTGALKQKGVDPRIVLDLVELAHDRAVGTAFLLAGDEDLLEGMKTVQDAGVRVILVDIPGGTISYQLLQQADDVVRLEEATLRDNLRRPTIEVAGGAGEEELELKPAPPPQDPAPSPSLDGEDVKSMVDHEARRSAEEWSEKVGDAEVGSVLADVDEGLRQHRNWLLPTRVDGWLLKASDQRLGGLLQREPDLHRPLRHPSTLALRGRVGR